MKVVMAENLSKIYAQAQGKKAVDDLSLSLEQGEIFGFLGPNGAGKTTTIKMITGLAYPDEGEIKIFQKPNNLLEVKEKIGFMSEQPYFYNHLTGYELLDFFAHLFPMENETRKKRICELLKQVGLEKAADIPIRRYSKGMNQRLGLAAALINDPQIIFLDEPLDGLDPLGRRQIKEIILNLKTKKKTVFFNSHILSDVEEICDHIGIIDNGVLIQAGDPKRLSKGYKNLEEYFVEQIAKHREEA
jgi:ABC-2 type transport system ATP-binding protein